MIERIISGGQTGADRAGLDVAKRVWTDHFFVGAVLRVE